MIKKRFLCIGASAAGIACINKLKMLDPNREILCFSAEPEIPYNKCVLADWLSLKKAESEVVLASLEQMRLKGVLFYPNTPIVRIDPIQKTVMSASGEVFAYDHLLIATGARPTQMSCIWTPFMGAPTRNVGYFTFHTAADTRAISDFIAQKQPKEAIIVGAGLTGLEAADALWQRGVTTITIIEKNDRIMSSVIPESASDFLDRRMRSLGINVVCNQQIVSVSENEMGVTIGLSSGEILKTSMLIVAAGVKSNSELALQAGIAYDQGAIITDSFMQTSISGIYAAGDVALVTDQITGEKIVSRTWPDAMAQGMTAAHAIAGVQKPYAGVVMSLNSAFFGLKFAASYANFNREVVMESIQFQEDPEPFFRYVRSHQGVVKGYCLIGDTREAPGLRRSLVTKQP